MGQILDKFGNKQKKEQEVMGIIDKCYDKFFLNTETWNKANFYHAICQTLEELNKKLGSTQFRVPKTSTIEEAYQGEGKELKKEEFEKILQAVILDSGVTGIGAKDLVLYIYGVPATALLLKKNLAPNIFPNSIFIPAITSATVFLLAKLNKI